MDIRNTKPFYYASGELYKPQLPMKCYFLKALVADPAVREAILIKGECALFGPDTEHLVLVPRYTDQSLFEVPVNGVVFANVFLAKESLQNDRFEPPKRPSPFVDVASITEQENIAKELQVTDPKLDPPVKMLDISGLTVEEIAKASHDPLELRRLAESKAKKKSEN